MKKFRLGLCLVLILTLCLSLGGCTGTGASTSEKAVTNLFQASVGDLTAYKKCVPDFVLDYQLKELKVEEGEYWKDMADEMHELQVLMERAYGKDIKVSVDVEEKEKIEEEDLEQVQQQLVEKYGGEIQVTSGYVVEGAVTYKGKDKENTEEFTVHTYKINGRWYAL